MGKINFCTETKSISLHFLQMFMPVLYEERRRRIGPF